MIRTSEAKQVINGLFEEEALVIGGLVALHGIDDQVVWRLLESLEVIRGRVLRQLEGRETSNCRAQSRTRLQPHPAIEEFLLRVRKA